MLPLDEYGGLSSFGRANDLFITEGTKLAEEACRTALVARLGLHTDVRRMPSFGLGCVAGAAGAAGIARVHDYLAGHGEHVALLVSVELCSLTIQHGDDSTANLVSSGLFGDSAAAVVMVGEQHPAGRGATRGPEMVGTRSSLYPDTADQLGWHIGDSGFGIMLSAGLPGVIAEHLADDVRSLPAEHGLTREDVSTWVVHAGGPRIFDAVADAPGPQEGDLALSRGSLATVGNSSSSSVLHVLAATLERGARTRRSNAATRHRARTGC